MAAVAMLLVFTSLYLTNHRSVAKSVDSLGSSDEMIRIFRSLENEFGRYLEASIFARMSASPSPPLVFEQELHIKKISVNLVNIGARVTASPESSNDVAEFKNKLDLIQAENDKVIEDSMKARLASAQEIHRLGQEAFDILARITERFFERRQTAVQGLRSNYEFTDYVFGAAIFATFLFVVAVIFYLYDQQSRSVLEEQLELANSELGSALKEFRMGHEVVLEEQRKRTMGRIAESIVHEIRNALMPVATLCDVLQRNETLSKDGLRQVHNIAEASRDVVVIVERLRSYSRKDRVDTELRIFDVRPLLTDLIEFLRPWWNDQARFEGRSIKVLCDLPEPAYVHAAGTDLRQVFSNILINAIEAIEDVGEVRVAAEMDSKWVIIRIRDEGHGMSESTRVRVMRGYFSTKPDGTGIGLQVCRELINRFRGKLEIESIDGVGTTCSVYLPRATPPVEDPTNTNEPSRSEPITALVIDDNAPARDSLIALLTSMNCVCTGAVDAKDGIAMMQRQDFDLVFVDFGLPDSDGRYVIQEIRERGSRARVCLLTGWNMEELELSEANFPDYFMTKPPPIEDLKNMVRDVSRARA